MVVALTQYTVLNNLHRTDINTVVEAGVNYCECTYSLGTLQTGTIGEHICSAITAAFSLYSTRPVVCFVVFFLFRIVSHFRMRSFR